MALLIKSCFRLIIFKQSEWHQCEKVPYEQMHVQNINEWTNRINFTKKTGGFHVFRPQIKCFPNPCLPPLGPSVAVPEADFFCQTKRFGKIIFDIWSNVSVKAVLVEERCRKNIKQCSKFFLLFKLSFVIAKVSVIMSSDDFIVDNGMRGAMGCLGEGGGVMMM